MDLKTYLAMPGALSVTELAERIGAKSATQVRQWQHGYAGRLPGPEYCVKIERVTDRLVTRQQLRPRDWAEIWPELVSEIKPKPAPVSATAGVFAIEPEARTPPPKPSNQPPAAVAGQGG